MRILIAEDDQDSRRTLFEFLAGFGSCDMAADGIEALDAFIRALNEGLPYNLICLDIIMPRMDGLMALQSIRGIERQRGLEKDERVKIIITTALVKTKDIAAVLSVGFESYVPKPIDRDGLMKVMEELKLVIHR